MVNTRTYEKRLKERLEALEARLHRIEDALDQPHSADWDEAATEHEEDEALEDLGQAGLTEIAAIQAALGRIENGLFGTCVRCGEEISTARLDAVPHTPFCRNCAR